MYSPTLFGALALFLLGVDATKQVQVNYYSDQSCTNYIGQVDVDWITGDDGWNCYKYKYGNSVNVAYSRNNKDAWCQFHETSDCTGQYALARWNQDGQNCAKNAQRFNSFRCFYFG
jgi:hypothetical protein